MPEAMKEGSTYVLTDELGQKTKFIFRGRDSKTAKLRLEVDGEIREYEDLTKLAEGHYSAVIEVEAVAGDGC